MIDSKLISDIPHCNFSHPRTYAIAIAKNKIVNPM